MMTSKISLTEILSKSTPSIRRFFGVNEPGYSDWSGMYATAGEAHAHACRGGGDYAAWNVIEKLLEKDALDRILEGEGTEKTWAAASEVK